jgi:hypothetical protein
MLSGPANSPIDPEVGMDDPQEAQPLGVLAARGANRGGLDTVDNCRMRLMALRTRIEANWPAAGGRFFSRGPRLGPESRESIHGLLVALPTPLPLVAGGPPEEIITAQDTDLVCVAGRAVDAGFALLDGATLETEYPGDVTLLDSHHPDALEPIVVSKPSVGLLVATIIGTLDAISELISLPPSGTTPRTTETPETAPSQLPHDRAGHRRGRRVPRI